MFMDLIKKFHFFSFKGPMFFLFVMYQFERESVFVWKGERDKEPILKKKNFSPKKTKLV